jgi:hypothetical protein
MFSFKAMSISEPIADPIAAGTTIPLNSVIFMANNDMSTYASSSNWSFINMAQSSGTPSQIRGCPLEANAGKLYSYYIYDSFVTNNAGAHSGLQTYNSSYLRSTTTYPYYSYINTNQAAGIHSHAISGLTGQTYNKFPISAVVASYKCIVSTTVIPKNAIIFAEAVQNEDFISIESFNKNPSGNGYFSNTSLLAGNTTWTSTYSPYSANNGIYGQSLTNFTITPYIATSGPHNHEESMGSSQDYNNNAQTSSVDTMTAGSGNPNHVHNADMSATVLTKVVYLNAYKAVRNTSIYKGMILGWTGTDAATLPKGWYICNGQTVNNYKTPTININAVISMTNEKNFHGYTTGNDTIFVSYNIGGTDGTHKHFTKTDATTNPNNNGSRVSYHSDLYTWDHRHTGLYSSAHYVGYYTLNFIIYLG